MDYENILEKKFNEQLSKGSDLGAGTSYFDREEAKAAAIPNSGDDIILATADDTIKVQSSSRSKHLVVYYKTKSGRWISKNTLFGTHYAEESGNYAMTDDAFKCRSTFKASVGHTLAHITVDGQQVTVYVFTKDTPVKFKNLGAVYIPAKTDAWDKTSSKMSVTRAAKDYAGLEVG